MSLLRDPKFTRIFHNEDLKIKINSKKTKKTEK